MGNKKSNHVNDCFGIDYFVVYYVVAVTAVVPAKAPFSTDVDVIIHDPSAT